MKMKLLGWLLVAGLILPGNDDVGARAVAPNTGLPPAVQEVPAEGKPVRYASGTIKSCTLAREYSVAGTSLPAGTKLNFGRSGEPENGTLGGDANIYGFDFPAGTTLRFRGSRVFHCTLPTDTAIRGVTLPAKSVVFFGNPIAKGDPGSWRCWFPTPTRVQGHLCGATTDGVGQIFYPSGKLRAAWLAEDEDIDGVPCTTKLLGMPPRVMSYGTDRMACFYESGRLQQAMIARDCTIHGQKFKTGDIVRLTPEGSLDPTPTTLRGKSRSGR